MLTLLTVIAVAVGGPFHHASLRVSLFTGATVRIMRGNRVIASSEEGNLSVRVRPGVYGVSAEEGETVTNRPHACAPARRVSVQRRAVSVKLYCQIK
jgi:hypothetical protein